MVCYFCLVGDILFDFFFIGLLRSTYSSSSMDS